MSSIDTISLPVASHQYVDRTVRTVARRYPRTSATVAVSRIGLSAHLGAQVLSVRPVADPVEDHPINPEAIVRIHRRPIRVAGVGVGHHAAAGNGADFPVRLHCS